MRPPSFIVAQQLKPPRAGALGFQGYFWAGCLLASMHMAAAADPLLDFGVFEVPAPSQRVQPAPVVSWLIHADAEHYCASAQPKDGFIARPQGCVFWQFEPSRCTIVTTASTTHSQLGRLFLHCVKGQ